MQSERDALLAKGRRVALVTGGASGIGRAAALALAGREHIVVVADLQEEAGASIVAELREAGADALFVHAEVSNPSNVEEAVRVTESSYGRLDVAVNAAGIGGPTAITHLYEEQAFDQVVAINLKGVWLAMKYEIAAMVESGGGAIVNVASGAAVVGVPTMAAYVASKAGVIGLTRTAAVEYAPVGIRVNAVNPGVIDTPMVRQLEVAGGGATEAAASATPMGRVGTPSEVGEVIAFLCSSQASYVTGTVVPVDGGLRSK